MWQLLIAFVLGGVAVSVLMALDPSLAAKVAAGEHGILAVLVSTWRTAVAFLEAVLGIKRKAAPATPAAPVAPTAPAAPIASATPKQ